MRSFKISLVPMVSVVFLLALFSTPLCASDNLPLRAGAARMDITPSDLTDLNPWGGSYSDVHDPIYARVLVLENGTTSAVFVALDAPDLGDTTEVRQRIQREFGIPVDHIIISASHDHSAPRIGSVTPGGLAHGPSAATPAYTKTVNDKIVAGVKQAKASEQPARFGLGTGFCDINVNRDGYSSTGWMGVNQSGPSDKTVWVLKFESLTGEPIGLLFNYAVHPSMSLGTGSVSGDLAGAAARYIEARYNNKIVALFSEGPAGDQDPRISGLVTANVSSAAGGQRGPGTAPSASGATGAPFEMKPMAKDQAAIVFDAVNSLGTVLGAEVVRTANQITNMTGSVRIAGGEHILTCPVKIGGADQVELNQEKVSTVPIHLGLIMLNQVALTGVSGEVSTNIFLHLKKDSPLTNTVLITLANDRIGYIVDDAAYDIPTHESTGTPVARGCAENGIVNGLVELINNSF
jgi:neutral ceramidase